MRFLAGFLFAIVVIVLGGYGFILSGIYNIAASVPHTALAEWILRTTMQHSVKRRAADIKAPSSFSEAELNDGFQEFNEMCVSCHGAPGKDPSEIGKGLRPRPPDLAKAALQLDKGDFSGL